MIVFLSLGMPYTSAIDSWSFACILAELYTGLPLFPGENELDQLSCIMEVLGVPEQDLLEQSTRRKYFFASSGKPRIIKNSRGIKRTPGSKSLSSVLGCSEDVLFVDFLSKFLRWNPRQRMTAADGLKHPWILKEMETEKGTSKKNPSDLDMDVAMDAIPARSVENPVLDTAKKEAHIVHADDSATTVEEGPSVSSLLDKSMSRVQKPVADIVLTSLRFPLLRSLSNCTTFELFVENRRVFRVKHLSLVRKEICPLGIRRSRSQSSEIV